MGAILFANINLTFYFAKRGVIMGKKKKNKPEIRADTMRNESAVTYPEVDVILLNALMGKNTVTKEMALQIPTVKACVNRITSIISSTPIRLYKKDESGKVEEITGDRRAFLLNDETGDTLTSAQFWRAMVEDYLVGKGGYAYINSSGLETVSIHYVDEKEISFMENNDPIFKDYDILVRGNRYTPFHFLKILRNTKDGIKSSSISDENPLLVSLAYASLVYEENLVKKGGNKRGFLESEHRLSEEAMEALRKAYKRLYSNNSENVVVLNNGVKFHEASNTSVEMQLDESKTSNGAEICKVFGVPVPILTGGATAEDRKIFLRTCVEIMYDIECSLDRDLLLESEKGILYWAFDTRELLRGDIKERYEAYEIALKNNFLQIDEVREQEDREPLGFGWITLGLDSVLYNPKTGAIYTPNTNAVQTMASLGKPLLEDSETRAYTGKNLVVAGPPGSGKSTWVQEQLEEEEIVLDLDAIKAALFGNAGGAFHSDCAQGTVKLLTMIRDTAYKAISRGLIEKRAYIITTEPDQKKLEALCEYVNADLKVMETDQETCVRRVKADRTRENKEVFYNLIHEWFEKRKEAR